MINTQINSENILLKLKDLAHKGIIRYTDYYFTNFIKNYFYNGSEVNDEVLILACFLSSETAKGHVCLDIYKLTEYQTFAALEINIPEVNVIKDIIQKNNKVFGNPDNLYETPIIFDNNRLYLGRYLYFEKELAFQIKKRLINSNLWNFDNEKLKNFLDQLFPSCKYSPDWQKISVLLAVLNNFSVISGGPGTGKTRTVASLLALLKRIACDNNRKNIKIGLAAPTGKAAARLSESINAECERLKKYFKDDVLWVNFIEDIPLECLTIHRLLKYNHSTSVFRHNRDNPLDFDVIVVDEVSMLDLSLMTRLISALPHDSKLIFLGDKDQLSSVENGSVLGDICSEVEKFDYSDEMRQKIEDLTGEKLRNYAHNKNNCQIRDAITILKNNYRFDETRGIGSLSKAINTGKPEQVMDILLSNKFNDISFEEVDAKSIGEHLKRDFIKKFEPYLIENDPKKAIELFNNFKILCAVKEGFYGVGYINHIIEEILDETGLISKNRRWYHGRPVMILENDYKLNLYNGDIGIILKNENFRDNMAFFLSSKDDGLKPFLPARLPAHESVYAMTIHKSQGSDFDETLIIIPEITEKNKNTLQILTKELLYTAVTRAKHKLTIWAKKAALMDMIPRTIERNSGLGERLWENNISTEPTLIY